MDVMGANRSIGNFNSLKSEVKSVSASALKAVCCRVLSDIIFMTIVTAKKHMNEKSVVASSPPR